MARTGRREGVFRGRDLTDEKFGRWTVKGRAAFNGRMWTWHCTCECGRTGEVMTQSLVRGDSQSCGCLRVERLQAAIRTHGLSRYARGSLERGLYTVWSGIKQRCETPTNHAFKWYGARGVQVHPEWSASFEAFRRDVGPRPSFAHSLDRWPNPKGNYEPGNVRWATRDQQAANRVDAVLYEHDGQQWTLPQLARAHGLHPSALRYRILHKGMSIAEALSVADRASTRARRPS